MISITLCRCGKYRDNLGVKGSFVKTFDSVESFVKFLYDNPKWFFCHKLKEELTSAQRKQVFQKLEALRVRKENLPN